MRRELLLILPALLGTACASFQGEEEVAGTLTATDQCDAHILDVYVSQLGQIQVNEAPSDLDGVRDAARSKASACRGMPASVDVLTQGIPNDTTRSVEALLHTEIENLELASSFFLHSHSRASADEITCEHISLDIVVTDDGQLLLNGSPYSIEAFEAHVEVMAAACRNESTKGTYEGPGHVTVISSMIWPILREELPNLELVERIRRPGGRGYYDG